MEVIERVKFLQSMEIRCFRFLNTHTLRKEVI
jgi:hypothetical protein